MPTAILTGPPVAGSQLEGDLRSLGFTVVTAADGAGLDTELGRLPAAERVALVDPRLVAHRHALRLGLTDPRFPISAVPGALTAQPAARSALRRALEAVAGTSQERAEALVGSAGGTSTVSAAPLPDAVAEELLRIDEPVHRPELGALVATVPGDEAARSRAREAVEAVDDEAIRLRSAVKSRDGFFTTFCVSTYSRYIARWCAHRGLTPNQVTTASLLTALIAAGCAATGSRSGFVAAGLLLLASFVLDCTDGQLARYSLQYSTLGAWLDATFDRAKEYAYYAGLAIGAARAGGDDVWALALGAMVLQTCRHVVDFSFNEAEQDAAGSGPTGLSNRLDSVGWTVWVRRMIILPIGERWALIAVLTALTTPRTVFTALLIGCGFAACYTTAGRVLRSLRRRGARSDRAALALDALADNGPLAEGFAAALHGPARRAPAYTAPTVALAGAAAVVGTAAFSDFAGVWPVAAALVAALAAGLAVATGLRGALDWLVPPLFRAAEYGTILVLAARSETAGALPAAFGLVSAVAYHHYDTVYRIRGGSGAPPHRLVLALGGHEGRVLLVILAAFTLPDTAFPLALTGLASVLALAVLIESVRFWVSSGAPAVHDETGEPA
ncbi:DUF5941 domain-containing protein [Streptomyces sp. TP-A0874]|uniref:DUF5941 domain-containing protein n=1 Tax=Streptomyces sp. TP-A0874 TaxID=549819 RepID=UPI000852EE14|nr:DUF5941 domain-containing protein [Streptomyces sp. TP-A0874]